MEKYKVLTLSILLILNHAISYSQTNDLSPAEIEEFKTQAGYLIDAFQAGLGKIAGKDIAESTKQSHTRNTLELFMGNGNYYFDTEEQRDKIVHIEVSSLYRDPEKRKIILKSYLYNLARLQYAKVEITSAEIARISDLYKQGDGYVATATISQKFCGYRDVEGKMTKIYCDITKKTFKILGYQCEDAFGKCWYVKLGDSTVDDITP